MGGVTRLSLAISPSLVVWRGRDIPWPWAVDLSAVVGARTINGSTTSRGSIILRATGSRAGARQGGHYDFQDQILSDIEVTLNELSSAGGSLLNDYTIVTGTAEGQNVIHNGTLLP